MTRGQIVIFHDEGITTSTEFNGDMYFATDDGYGYGTEVVEALKDIHSLEDYKKFVTAFNKKNFSMKKNCSTIRLRTEERSTRRCQIKLRRISRKVAREKYGVLTGGVNSMYDYFLREDGCVVDSDADLRYIPPYEDSMYKAEVEITDGKGKVVPYFMYSRLLEYAKSDAINRLVSMSSGCAHGELHISLVISKNGEYVDSDEWFADWNGKTVTAKEDVV